MIAVSDTGIGMDGSVQEHLFEPFYTTKEPGKGTGLGLATVYGVVKQSGGSICVYSEAGHGTSFKVFLPRVESAGDAATPFEPILPGLRGAETILLVEDQPEVRSVVEKILTRHGYSVVAADNGAEALHTATTYPGRIDLLISDAVMPGMSGRDVATRFLRTRPEARELYMSGYTDDSVVRQGIINHSAAFIQKPLTPARLLRKIREVLDADAPRESA